MNRTLTKKLAQVKPGTLCVGVDMGQAHNVAVVLGERAERLTRFRFPNDRDGYAYFRKRLKALQTCRNKVNKGKPLFVDRASTVAHTDPADCDNEFKTNEASLKAAASLRRLLAKPSAPRCTDALVSMLGACAPTVNGLDNAAGDGGCLISVHHSSVNDLVNAEYGP